MKFLWWREKPWQQRVLLVLTAVALVLLAVASRAAPACSRRRPARPGPDGAAGCFAAVGCTAPRRGCVVARAASVTAQLYFLFIFSLGIVGPYVDGLLRAPKAG
jgi:hypothetical protein